MRRALTIVIAVFLVGAAGAQAQTLRGSRVAMQRQNSVAHEQDYTFMQTTAQVRKFADLGLLVRMSGNAHYQLVGVSHPYARPALKTFIERLARQYHAACGEKLVVTSLTRPVSGQPRNAHQLSVHPAGMATDLRISKRRSCQRWLEGTLLALEDRNLLEATKERNPPHFHVAVFPEEYLAYVRGQDGSPVKLAGSKATSAPAESGDAEAASSKPGSSAVASAPAGGAEKYRVNRGDTLWTIARRYGTTVALLKETNNLRTTRIKAGQVITIPVSNIAP